MRLPLVTILLILAAGLAAPVHADLAPVPMELAILADVVMADLSAGAVERAAREAEQAIAAIPDGATRDLHNAQRLFLLGFDAIGRGETRSGEAYVEEAMELARASLEVHESSEGHRILADGYNQLLKVRGRGYQILHFRAAHRAALRAVELDRTNPLAHVSAASYYLSAPRIAGGDVRLGLEHVEAAARLNGDNRYVAFLVAVWAARGASQTGSQESARRSLRHAAEIYPDNWWLNEVSEELGISL
jgi:tetratricopeptide (TPR) repeat protein